eukprot:1157784-Pelagomonas_calceolata.AAC.5
MSCLTSIAPAKAFKHWNGVVHAASSVSYSTVCVCATQHRHELRAAVAATGYSGVLECVPLCRVFQDETCTSHGQQLEKLRRLVRVSGVRGAMSEGA